MKESRTTRQKIGAVLVVIILFALVAGFFGAVGLYNHQMTLKLQSEARQAKYETLLLKKLNKLFLSDTDFSQISAKAFLVAVYLPEGREKTLVEFNSSSTLPIASVTKLMTALVLKEHANLNQSLVASKIYTTGDGSFGVLKEGKSYKATDLFKNMLIASDNDSARLLSSILGEDAVVKLMNEKAQQLNLTQTYFFNVTGLDPLEKGGALNVSSANDIKKLLIYILENQPDILKINSEIDYNFCATDNSCWKVSNTNRLVEKQNFKHKIFGGKTGQTDMAGRNLALIMTPLNDIFLVSIVLGSADHFADTETIVNKININ